MKTCTFILFVFIALSYCINTHGKSHASFEKFTHASKGHKNKGDKNKSHKNKGDKNKSHEKTTKHAKKSKQRVHTPPSDDITDTHSREMTHRSKLNIDDAPAAKILPLHPSSPQSLPMERFANNEQLLTQQKLHTLKNLILLISTLGIKPNDENKEMTELVSRFDKEAIHLLQQPKLQHVLNLPNLDQQTGNIETQQVLDKLLENPTIKHFLDQPQPVLFYAASSASRVI